MPTIADHIMTMADMVRDIKRSHRLTEGTILRIIDTTLAVAQNQMPIVNENPDSQEAPPIPTDEELAEMLNIEPNTEETTNGN